jgi:hypothetical protein
MKKLLIILLILAGAGLSIRAQQPTTTDRKVFSDMLTAYLMIKDALMADNGTQAAEAATGVLSALDKVQPATLSEAEAKVFNSAAPKIRMNAEHIRENATKVGHQREHFDFLGDKIHAVVKGIHFPHPALYYFYSAQGREGEAAHWLSDRDEMKDPYFSGQVKASNKRVEAIPAVAGAELHYACPMHPEATSDRPAQCPTCGMNMQQVKP